MKLSTNSGSLLSFEFWVGELSQAPPFDALSYTWGDPYSPYLKPQPDYRPDPEVPSIPTLCKEKILFIRPNLEGALQAISNLSLFPRPFSRQKYIWIDAICIDQSNLLERERQVALMGELYQRAESVIAWLGPESVETCGSYTVVDRLSSVSVIPESLSEVSSLQQTYSGFKMKDIVDPEVYKTKLGILPLQIEHWLAFISFLTRPYFSRAWIVQEVTFAKSIVCVCGTLVFDWDKLAAAAWFLIYTGWDMCLHTTYFRNYILRETDPGVYAPVMREILRPLHSVFYLNKRRVSRSENNLAALGVVIIDHRSTSASDPRDKIYALIGIANRQKEPSLEHWRMIQPSYRISVEQVYTSATRAICLYRKSLNFVLTCREHGYRRKIISLPSWVPDYSADAVIDSILKRGGSPSTYDASNGHQWQDHRALGDPSLDVKGIRLGKIIARSSNEQVVKDYYKYWSDICAVGLGLETHYLVCGPDTYVLSLPSINSISLSHFVSEINHRMEIVMISSLLFRPGPKYSGGLLSQTLSKTSIRLLTQLESSSLLT
jgi:heterokaryon incompatibility protein (HET)